MASEANAAVGARSPKNRRLFAPPHLIRSGGIGYAGLALLSLLPAAYMEMKMAILIAAACPVGSNVAVYAHLHDRNYPYAVETVVISTILSLISIPLLVALAQMVW